MNDHENLLYSSMSQGFALVRTGAYLRLKNSKCWGSDGAITTAMGICPAYTIHELLNIKFEETFELEISGNARLDLAMAVKKIVDRQLRLSPFPFRVWNSGRYVQCGPGSQMQIVINSCGSPTCLKRTSQGLKEEPANNLIIEPYLFMCDHFGVPIFDCDAVLAGKEIMRVRKTINGVQLFRMEDAACCSASLDVYSERMRCAVIGSSRFDLEILRKIAEAISKNI